LLREPLTWRKPRRVFVCSMTDVFADFITDEMLDKMFAVMARCPQHTFQVLTKRSERMRGYFASRDLTKRIAGAIGEISRNEWDTVMSVVPLPNVWLGVSAERQQEAEERIPHLLETPAAVRFVS